MLLGLGSGLTQQGHEVFVYGYGGGAGRDPDEQTLRKAADAGIQVRVIHRPTGLSPLPLAFGRDRLLLTLAANEDRLDLMVVHGIFGRFSGRIAQACMKAGTPCIACPHDPYSPELFGTRTIVKRAYWRLFEAPFLRRMRAVHVLAPSHVGYLRALGISTPAFVVPNGLGRGEPEELPQESDRSRLPARQDERFLLLYLGRWDVYNKGLDLLLKALDADPTLGSEFTIQIAGKGSKRERRELERLISRLHVADRVSLVGFLQDTGSAIRSADALILPSRFDGFGQVVIEALSLGTPVIVSSKAGCSEFLSPDLGALVIEPDIPGLVRGLRSALQTKHELREAARASRARLAREFDWDELARRWLEEVGRAGVLQTRSGP
jgi:glycosyltransferase involved in cell wall biosynthesis